MPGHQPDTQQPGTTQPADTTVAPPHGPHHTVILDIVTLAHTVDITAPTPDTDMVVLIAAPMTGHTEVPTEAHMLAITLPGSELEI